MLSVITPVYLLHFLCLFCPSCFSSLPLPKLPPYFQLFPALRFRLLFLSFFPLCFCCTAYQQCICHYKPGSCASARNQPKQQSVDANEFKSSCGDRLDISPPFLDKRATKASYSPKTFFLVALPTLFLAPFSCLLNACLGPARLHRERAEEVEAVFVSCFKQVG